MRFFRSLRDEQGLQTLGWVALALVILALIGGGLFPGPAFQRSGGKRDGCHYGDVLMLGG